MEFISRLMSWTTFDSDDGRLVHFHEGRLRNEKASILRRESGPPEKQLPN